MKLFSSESIFNAKTGKWEERYWINGNPVDGDLYFFEQDVEKKLEADKLLKQIEIEDRINIIDPCDGCKCRECCEAEDELTYDELLEIFVDRILEIGPCPVCLKELLDIFAEEIIDFVDDEDEYED